MGREAHDASGPARFRLDGKVALVTGASRGIGEAIALGFAAAGARVVLASRKAEVGGRGIRVNAIAPGLIETRFAAAIVGNEALRDPIVARTPLGRHGQPDEIVGAALFLASSAASFVNGHTLVVDGGMTIS